METTTPRRRRATAFRRAGWLGVLLMTSLALAGPGAVGAAAAAVAPGAATLATLAAVAPVCGTTPLDVELIIDTSGSMGSNSSGSPISKTRLGWAKQAATQLVSALDSHGGVGGTGLHHVGLTYFSGTTATTSVHLVASAAAASAAVVDAAISSLSSNGSTPFLTGMNTGQADMAAGKRSGATHVYVFLSDGSPNPASSQTPSSTQITTFKNTADIVWSVAIGTGASSGTNGVNLPLMMSLAQPSGDFAHATDASTLPDVFSTIYNSIACTANVTAVKSASSTSDLSGATAQPGDTLSYSIALSNSGNSALTGVSVSDDISSLLTYGAYVPASADNGGSFSSPTVSWSGLTVPTSGLTLHFQVLLNEAGFPVGKTTLGNTVLVTGTGSNCTTDTTAAACSTSTTVTIPGQSGLSITKGVALNASGPFTSGLSTTVGTTVYYEIVVTNAGNVPLTDVTLVDDHTTLSDVCAIPTTLAVGAAITCYYSSSAVLGLTTNMATAGASGLDFENASASVTASSPSCEESGTCPTTPPSNPPTSPPCTPENFCYFNTPTPTATPTATPTPTPTATPTATPTPTPTATSAVLAATSKPNITPPPTSSLGGTTGGPSSGIWLVLLVLAGLLGSILLLTPAPARARRKR